MKSKTGAWVQGKMPKVKVYRNSQYKEADLFNQGLCVLYLMDGTIANGLYKYKYNPDETPRFVRHWLCQSGYGAKISDYDVAAYAIVGQEELSIKEEGE